MGGIVFRRKIQHKGLEMNLGSYKSREHKKQPLEIPVPVLARGLPDKDNVEATGDVKAPIRTNLMPPYEWGGGRGK